MFVACQTWCFDLRFVFVVARFLHLVRGGGGSKKRGGGGGSGSGGAPGAGGAGGCKRK
jgi:hypothetical protein